MTSTTSWTPPKDCKDRPVAILGAGVLGRRIAACWASGGYNVRVRDPDAKTRADCLEYAKDHAATYPAAQTRKGPAGHVEVFDDVASTVDNAWLVIEAIPEKLQLKIDQFAELEKLAPEDAILATNSSSYKSSEMLAKVSDSTKSRILNTHYYMPPQAMIVELMTDGHTDPAIIDFLAARQREAGTSPYVARKESTGLIFNRLWAAVKRETLTILAEGVSVPKEIDDMWRELMLKNGSGPCASMDGVGLDTVAFIEDHYVQERGLSAEKTSEWLRKNYISQGKLGNKSDNGGLYPRPARILALDVGLAAPETSMGEGYVLQFAPDGKTEKTILSKQSLPDGIDVDHHSGRMFWTCMGMPGKGDGEILSANLDGSDVCTVVPKGTINTPKQLTVEPETRKLYFADREGMSILRCDYDGSSLEVLVRNGDWQADGFEDQTKWCVGIAVLPKLGKFYWTQKGFSKSGKGRIFCANIETPATGDCAGRDDIQLVQDKLPEPIDLEIDTTTDTLYWTDRGELPFGNSVNRAKLDLATGLFAKSEDGKAPYEVIVRHLNEAIGLKLDQANGHLYVTDLGGSLYRCNRDGSGKERVYSSEDRALTGIALY